MKIAFGVDPGGFCLREGVLAHLKEKGHEVLDLGTQDMDNPIPYMIVGRNVAEAVTSGKADFGVVMCGTGMGISIATNKVKGARCAMVESYYAARESRIINDANIIALGGTTTSLRMACEMIDVFLETKWGQGLPDFRVQRIKDGAKKLAEYEDEQFGK
ncbi:MAG TPA: RpiB/LacA/LacB family sugar-phosphate isomerase [Thermoclostridium sp.]|nr:RpiB/LacA/LacB family sugar-phosphate isomerase [Thermoclostridium sp.]HPU45359.1 RpiB/LacA/LacB family sugar-phosphate isomerase [Thermoclostridium sp.]